MNTQMNMEERLWDYIDGSCPEAERSFIEELIQSRQEWREKYQELLGLHQMLSNDIELEEPSMRFTRNVMEEIGRLQIAPATRSYIDKKVIWGIGLFFLIMIAGLLIYTIGQINWTADNPNINLPVNLNEFDWNKVFNNTYTTIFMMVNVVLGLMLLDMYLGKKKKQWQQKHSV